MSERLQLSPEQRRASLRSSSLWATVGLLICTSCGSTETAPAPEAAPASMTASPAMRGPSAGRAGSMASGVPSAPIRPTRSAAGQGGTGVPSAGASGAPAANGAGAVAQAGTGGDAAASAGASGAAGAAGSGMSATAMFKRACMDFDPGPCASYIPGGEFGVPEMELGPYGASLDFNVGEKFAYPIAAGDDDNDATCSALSNGQTGRVQQSVDYTLYSVYRPGLYKEGEKYPLIVWGDGTCAWPEAYGPLLRYVASHGFIVVAPNSRWVGDGSQMKKGLDFMFAATDDMASPYYQKVDTTKVGAMGHSQGGSGTIAAASDTRVKAVIIWNGGTSASKPFLAVTGDGDILNATPASMRRDMQAAAVPQGAFLFYHMIAMKGSSPGHLTLVTEPERVVEPALAWWQYMLNGDAEAAKFFVGDDCKLCNREAEFEFGQKGLQ